MADIYEFDFGRSRWFPPFSMLLLAIILKRFSDSRPDCRCRARNHEAHTYAAHLGFFRSFGLQHGNPPGAATGSDNYVPIKRLDVEEIRREAIARWVEVGATWQLGNGSAPGDTIQALVIENPDSPHSRAPLVVMAAQHARELATAEIATRFAELLVENPADDPDIEWLLDHRQVHVIAQQNPDGRRQVGVDAVQALEGPAGDVVARARRPESGLDVEKARRAGRDEIGRAHV